MTTDPADQLRAATALLSDTESYLSALHGAVARHDNLGANLTCSGCQLRDRITPALAVARQVLGTTDQQQAETACSLPDFMACGCNHIDGCQHPVTPGRQPNACPQCGDTGACNGGPCPLGTVTASPEGEAPLRDRIRRAVCEAEGFGWDTDMLEPDEYGEVADAVLAVLPTPVVDWPAILRQTADRMNPAWFTDAATAAAAKAEFRRLADEAQQPTDAVTEPRRRCAHTDALYGQCTRYLDDHDGDCWHAQQPAPAVTEEAK